MKNLNPLIEEFKSAANPEKAKWMKDYLRGKFELYGINTKERREIQKTFFKLNGYPETSELFDVVLFLWELPQREYQYLAIELLQRNSKKLLESDINNIEKIIVAKSWWDSVDGIAAWICGAYFKLYPQQIIPVTTDWMKSGNMWLQRSVLLFQLKYKSETNTELLSKWIKELADHKDFFIRKAIGWVLREYSKTNPKWVIDFVNENQLSGLSKREALKHVNKK
jgi:3-methyladenine DNA glycosylase AlkD